MSRSRVVITGLGVVSPMGLTRESFWNNLVKGYVAIDRIQAFDPEGLPSHIAAEVRDFDAGELLNDKKLARRTDRFCQFALYAARQAWEQAALKSDALDLERVGVIVGNGSAALTTIESQQILGLEKGYRKVTPFLVPMIIPDTASGHISIEFGTKGPHYSMATACATGADAIGHATRMIQSGEIDVAFAGGSEGAITPLAVAGFGNARALSGRNHDPKAASRPFDADRDGFVMGEGAGVLILESYEHAIERGATILAEVAGYGRTSDGYEITSPHPEGDGSIRAMRLALKEAGIEPQTIGYINAHATSTPVGDVAEARAIHQVFGEHVAVGSTKSMMGHTLGAAGALEAVITLLALQHQELPPTMNVDKLDPDIHLDVVANVSRKVSGMEYAMSNSFGFFGHNACLILKRVTKS